MLGLFFLGVLLVSWAFCGYVVSRMVAMMFWVVATRWLFQYLGGVLLVFIKITQV